MDFLKIKTSLQYLEINNSLMAFSVNILEKKRWIYKNRFSRKDNNAEAIHSR